MFLTHAHADHDWNAAKLQRSGIKIMLSVKNLGLRQNFAAQTVLPTAEKYRMRNVIQNISIRLLKSPPYEPDIRITDSDSGLLLKLGFDAELKYILEQLLEKVFL